MPVDGHLYPVNLVLRGRRCVVIGGGPVAARKAAALVAAGADVEVVAPQVTQQIETMGVRVTRRPYQRHDLDGAWLAVVATGDPELNRTVHADADAARVWVNAADDPRACSFTLPAVARQGPVMVTVSTSGYSPALAAWLRSHVSEHLGPEMAVLAQWLSAARDEVKAAGGSTEAVDWRPVLDWDMLDLIRTGRTAQARERLQACLPSSLD